MIINCVYLYKLILSGLFHYPIYKDSQIEKIIRKFGPSGSDLKELQSFSHTRWKLWHIIVLIMAIVFFLFHVYTSMFLFLSFDYINPENNLEFTGNGEVKFWCLHTNCSRLFKNSDKNNNDNDNDNDSYKFNETLNVESNDLANDFLYLPYYAICRPIMRRFAFPAADFGLNGYFYIQIIGLGMFDFCVIGQIAQFLDPSGDETILFVYAPELMLKMIRESMRKSYIDLLTSMFIFKSNRIRNLIERRLTRLNKANITHDSRFIALNEKIVDPYDYDKLIKAHYQHGKTTHIEEFIEDCLPLIRTDWWRQRILFSYKIFMSIILPYNVISGTIAGSNVFTKGIKLREPIFERIGATLSEQNCFLWTNQQKSYDNINEGDKQIIDMSKFKTPFGWLPYIQQYYASITNQLILNSTLLGAWISQTELLTLIREIHSQLYILIELASIYINLVECDDIDSVKFDDTFNSRALSQLPKKSINYANLSDKHDDDIVQTIDYEIEFHTHEFIKLIEDEKRTIQINCINHPNEEALFDDPKTFRLSNMRELLRLQHVNKRWISPTGNALNDRIEPTKAKKLNNLIFNQRFALEIYLTNPNNLNTFIELSEKLYIKMKFYINVRKNYSKSMAAMLFYFSLCSYINLYWTLLLLYNRIQDKTLLEGLIILCFLYVVMCLFVVASLNNHVSSLC